MTEVMVNKCTTQINLMNHSNFKENKKYFQINGNYIIIIIKRITSIKI